MISIPLKLRYLCIALLSVGIAVYILGGILETSDSTEAMPSSVIEQEEVSEPKQHEAVHDEAALQMVSMEVALALTESSEFEDQSNVEGHQVSLRSQPGTISYVLRESPTRAQLQLLEEAGAWVEPSASGRTGPVVRFGRQQNALEQIDLRQLLADADLYCEGQLLELRMQSLHTHEFCGSCLSANAAELTQLHGVLSVPRYLGDPTGEAVDVLVDPEVVSIDEVIRTLQVDHAQISHL